MSQNFLPLTADDLVRLQMNELDEIKGEFAFAEKQTVIAVAVKWAMRFGASTPMHDELIRLSLKEIPVGGLRYALLLAARASTTVKEQLLVVMLGPFQMHQVKPVITYAKDVLGRELSRKEVEKMKKWFGACNNDNEKKELQCLLYYVEETYPELFEEFKKYFEHKQAFWDGPGSLL